MEPALRRLTFDVLFEFDDADNSVLEGGSLRLVGPYPVGWGWGWRWRWRWLWLFLVTRLLRNLAETKDHRRFALDELRLLGTFSSRLDDHVFIKIAFIFVGIGMGMGMD